MTADLKSILVAIYILLLTAQQSTLKVPTLNSHKIRHTSLRKVLALLKGHLETGSAFLPVIAIYSIYEILIKAAERYKGKTLLPLRSPQSPDVRAGSIGDIQIISEDGTFFEAAEVKHNRQIDSTSVKDAFEKFRNTNLARYYILTTAQPYSPPDELSRIETVVAQISESHGCEIVVNGVFPTISYYLRLLPVPGLILERYTNNVFQQFTAGNISSQEVEIWDEILRRESLIE